MATRSGRNCGACFLISYLAALERLSLRHTTPSPSCSEMVTRAGRDNKSLCPTACIIHAIRQPPLYSMSHDLSCLPIEIARHSEPSNWNARFSDSQAIVLRAGHSCDNYDSVAPHTTRLRRPTVRDSEYYTFQQVAIPSTARSTTVRVSE